MADATTGNGNADNLRKGILNSWPIPSHWCDDGSGRTELCAESPDQVLLLAILDLTAQSVCFAGLGRPFKSVEQYETYKAELIGIAINRARRGVPVKYPAGQPSD